MFCQSSELCRAIYHETAVDSCTLVHSSRKNYILNSAKKPNVKESYDNFHVTLLASKWNFLCATLAHSSSSHVSLPHHAPSVTSPLLFGKHVYTAEQVNLRMKEIKTRRSEQRAEKGKREEWRRKCEKGEQWEKEKK